MSTPYRADHVGSFLRPPELLEARKSAANNGAQLHAIEDRQIDRVLAKQKDLGFEIFTDGEFRRRNFMSDFTDAVAGFDLGDAVSRTWKAGEAKDAPVSSVTGIVTRKLRARGPAHRPRTAVPESPQPRRHQNDAPQRHPIPGHLLQTRHHRQSLQRSFRTPLGYRRNNEDRNSRGFPPKA